MSRLLCPLVLNHTPRSNLKMVSSVLTCDTWMSPDQECPDNVYGEWFCYKRILIQQNIIITVKYSMSWKLSIDDFVSKIERARDLIRMVWGVDQRWSAELRAPVLWWTWLWLWVTSCNVPCFDWDFWILSMLFAHVSVTSGFVPVPTFPFDYWGSWWLEIPPKGRSTKSSGVSFHVAAQGCRKDELLIISP